MSVEVDRQVPDFTAPATCGDFSLSALRGKKLVLYAVYGRFTRSQVSLG